MGSKKNGRNIGDSVPCFSSFATVRLVVSVVERPQEVSQRRVECCKERIFLYILTLKKLILHLDPGGKLFSVFPPISSSRVVAL
jgi:hypothetical protein